MGQVGSDSAGSEILGARRLLREIGVVGRVVTLDAPHSYPNTARQIVGGGGDYVMPIKANHQALLDDVRILDSNAAPSRTSVDKGRTCAVLPLGPAHDDVADLPGRRQAFRIVRRRTVVKSGSTTEETVHGRTSRIRKGKLPRNLACLSNAAVAGVPARAAAAPRQPSTRSPLLRSQRVLRPKVGRRQHRRGASGAGQPPPAAPGRRPAHPHRPVERPVLREHPHRQAVIKPTGWRTVAPGRCRSRAKPLTIPKSRG